MMVPREWHRLARAFRQSVRKGEFYATLTVVSGALALFCLAMLWLGRYVNGESGP